MVTVNHNESVEDAIKIMLKEDYSQLPVVEGEKVVGVISYESLAKAVFSFPESKSKPPAKVRTKDCMEGGSKLYGVEDDMMNLLSAFAEKAHVLIRKRSKVTDIITRYDALWFFKTYGKRFLSSKFEKGEFCVGDKSICSRARALNE